MRVAFCADVHIGNHGRGPLNCGINDRCDLTLKTLATALETAKDHGCEDFCILGDLFHTVKPLPQIIKATQDVFSNAPDIGVTISVGNHEQSSTELGDHALGPLSQAPYVLSVDTPTRIGFGETHHRRALLLPYYPRNSWKLIQQTLIEKGPCELLGLHVGLAFGDEPSYLLGDDSVDVHKLVKAAKEQGIKTILAGHWHKHQIKVIGGITVAQIGALCPTGYGDAGFIQYGKLAIWDTKDDSLTWVEVPGPRFIKAIGLEEGRRRAKVIAGEVAKGNFAHFRWIVPEADLQEAQTDFDLWGFAGEVISDGVDAEVASREAAAEAKSSETITEALDSYVAALNLPDGVDHAWVLHRCREYLNG